MAVGQEVGTSDRSVPQATTGIDHKRRSNRQGFNGLGDRCFRAQFSLTQFSFDMGRKRGDTCLGDVEFPIHRSWLAVSISISCVPA